MKVKELLEITPQIVEIDIDIRNNGRYNYKYVVGEHIQLHDGYTKIGTYKHYSLEMGERLDYDTNNITFPATFWAIDPRKIERKVLELDITDLRLSDVFKDYLYKDKKIGWKALIAYITSDIGDAEFNGKCVKKLENSIKNHIDIDKDQMNINDFLEGASNG